LASHAAFNPLQGLKQMARLKRSLCLYNAIQKPRLRKKIYRLGLINGGTTQDVHTNPGQCIDRVNDIRGSIAQVRAE
jgi:hypothetical protein